MWNLKMKVTFLAVLLISFVKMVSSSDDKEKMPQLNDPFTIIAKDVDKARNNSNLRSGSESEEKKETEGNQDKEGGFPTESMDSTSIQLFSTPLKRPSLRTEGMINPGESPIKPRIVFFTHDGITYRENPSVRGRYTTKFNEKDLKLQERRQMRLYLKSAFRKRSYSEGNDYELPRKSRDLRPSPTRERRRRVFEYHKKDEDDEEEKIEIDQLTAGLSKATLEEMEEGNDKDLVVNLFDQINQASDSILDKETGEKNIKTTDKVDEEDEDDDSDDGDYEPQEEEDDSEEDSSETLEDEDEENGKDKVGEEDDEEDSEDDIDDDSTDDECESTETQAGNEGSDEYPYFEFHEENWET